MIFNRDDTMGTIILKMIALVLLCCVLMSWCNSCSMSSGREQAGMVYIQEGFCYDAETKFIYREITITNGKYADTPTYTIYINENGNYCKYNYGRWEEFVK